MLKTKVYAEEWEIDKRLAEFGFTRRELVEVLQKTLAERSNTLDVDVLNAPGTLAYIHGSRHLRMLAVSKGYVVNREKNIESSLNISTGVKIAYQNVEHAASPLYSPRAISGKKAGSADIIEKAQGVLFTSKDFPETVDVTKVKRLNSSIWYLCASYERDEISAELSLPASVKCGNFYGFLERIFIIQSGKWIGEPAYTTDGDMAEFEPIISRK